MPDQAPTEVELCEANASMDEAARELYELFKNAPKPKNSGRWGCRQYIPTRRPDGEIDFVFDRSAWAVHLMVGRAIARMLRQHEARS